MYMRLLVKKLVSSKSSENVITDFDHDVAAVVCPP